MFVRTLFDSLTLVMACRRHQPQTPSGIIDVRSLSFRRLRKYGSAHFQHHPDGDLDDSINASGQRK